MSLIIERVLDSFFEFQYKGETFMDSAPSLSFVNDFCHFKTKNGANIIKEQNILPQDITIIDTFGGSGNFIPSNKINLVLKLVELNFFQDRVSALTAGVTKFTQLLDTFNLFGNDGKAVVVDEAQMRLRPIEFYNYNKITQFSDVSISNLVNGKNLGVRLVNGVPKIVLVDTDIRVQETAKKLIVIAEQGQTEISVNDAPSEIFLHNNGAWLIESLDYNYQDGLITLLIEANEGDYFEIIPLSSNIRKQVILADSNNQTEFNININSPFIDVWLNGSKLRESLDFTRTLQSTDNKIILINQFLINRIETNDILEVLNY